MKRPSFILASTSPRRIEILNRLGFSFKSVPPDFDESSISIEKPFTAPEILARHKALSIAPLYPQNLVMAFDTLVILDGNIFGKPKDLDEAANFLRRLSGKEHQVITGCSLVFLQKSFIKTFSDISRVVFKALSEEEIHFYINRVNTLDKAGAYAIQEYGEMLIDHIEGTMDNIIGLPSEKLISVLKNTALENPDIFE